jgi:hypothetical protein
VRFQCCVGNASPNWLYLITLTPHPAKKKIGPRLTRDIRRDILLLRELNDYDEDETEYTYECIAELLSKRYGRPSLSEK